MRLSSQHNMMRATCHAACVSGPARRAISSRSWIATMLVLVLAGRGGARSLRLLITWAVGTDCGAVDSLSHTTPGNPMVMIGPAGSRGCISLNTFDCCQLLDCEPGFSFAACLNLPRSKIHHKLASFIKFFKIYLKISHLISTSHNFVECFWTFINVYENVHSMNHDFEFCFWRLK